MKLAHYQSTASGTGSALQALRVALTFCALILISLQTGCRSAGFDDQAPLAIESFTATPSAISVGQSTLIAWAVTGASTLSISDGNGPLPGGSITPYSANSATVTPMQTTTYTLTATDQKGNTQSAAVTVTVAPPPVITSFTASPGLISNNQSSTLSWVVSGASTLSIDNGIGTVTGTSITVTPTVTTTYTLTAFNAAGATATAQATVTVVLKPIITSFVATPPVIGSGQSSVLSWMVIGATGLSINNGVGPVTGSSVSVAPTQTTTYTLTAANTVNGFTATSVAEATVTVSSVPPPSISSFTSSAPSVGVGAEVTLTPVFIPTDGSATATIDQGIGTVTSGVPVDTPPLSASTTYTLTVTNAGGTATAQTRVLAGNLSVFAGSPTNAGYMDGAGTAARFNRPSGLAVDSSGNIYVADSQNDVIREITPAGVTSTLAGNPDVPGSTDGTGSGASFNAPYGVAVDSSGNVYVTDAGNATIRMITPGAVVTTLAGTAGVIGNLDGTGAAAEFGALGAIAIDPSGNLYVADALNCNVRMITSAGVVTTVAGPSGVSGVCGSTDGTGSAARFNSPVGIAVDSASNLYIADQNNQTIRKITPAALVTTLAGTPGVRGSTNGTGPAASFNVPTGVAVDSGGNVYVADSQNYIVRKITPDAFVTTIIGQAGVPNPLVTGGPLPSELATPSQLVTDPTSGRMFISLTVNAIATTPY